MKRVKFIYNPYSGENSIVKNLDKVIDIHQRYGYIVEPFRISKDVQLEDAFDDIDDNYHYILIAGGDGTIDSVVNIIKKRNMEIPVGFLPVGTANDFAKYLGFPQNVEEACIQILESRPKRFDLGKINNKYFVNVASTGAFTDISQKTDNSMKNSMGKAAYYLKAVEEVKNIKNINVCIKSEDYDFKGSIYALLVFNGQTAGNIKFVDGSKADDGLLDVVVIKEEILKSALNNILIMIKKGQFSDMDGVAYFKTSKLQVECEEAIVTDIDGERGPDFPLTISCERRAIRILGYK